MVKSQTPANLPEKVSVRVPGEVWHELKVEAAFSRKDIGELIGAAWKLYKKSNPQPWREGRMT